VAFPYICRLIEDGKFAGKLNFSANEYSDHHSDIETKLTDLEKPFVKTYFA
jgi:hypothetical protein